MAFISLRQLLDHAAEHGYGVPAFNINNLEQIHAIMQAAQETDSPVILQASAACADFRFGWNGCSMKRTKPANP
jgi:fructose-bisphosphate aldolase, class II